MPKFRKKPVVIEASQWHMDGDHPVVRPLHCVESKKTVYCKQCDYRMPEHGCCPTLEGTHVVCPGDWIITGVKGEKYPCKPDIFEATYEPV